MDEESVPGSAVPPDPGYHDDDELAAALAAQLNRVIETGSVPMQGDGAVPEALPARPAAATPRPAPELPGTRGPSAASPPPEPAPATGPLRPPSHRAAAAASGAGPSSAGEALAPRAERVRTRGHRADPGWDASATLAPSSSASAAPPATGPSPTAPPPSATGSLPVPTGPVRRDTGSLPLGTGPLPIDTGSLPLDTDSLPLSRRARRAAERVREQAQAAATPPREASATEPPPTQPVQLPFATHHRHAAPTARAGVAALAGAATSVPSEPVEPERRPAAVPREPARTSPVEEAADAGVPAPAPRHPLLLGLPAAPEDPEPAPGPVRHRRSFRPPVEQPAGPEPQRLDAPAGTEAQRPAATTAPATEPVAVPARPDERPEPSVPAPGVSEAWGRALRILSAPAAEDAGPEDAGAPEPVRVDAGSWSEEPSRTTGTVVLSGSPTEPVPVAEPDDAVDVDEVESGYRALAADTASVGLLPPLVDEGGRHVVPPISRASLDRRGVPDLVTEERASRPRRGGLLAPLATWAGVAGSPLALLVGFALGGGASTVVGLLIGLVLALPAVVRLGAVGARTGRDAVGAARAALGEETGTAAGITLLVGRIAIAALGLLGVAEIATSYAARTGLGGTLPTSGAAILAVLVAGLLSLAVGAWPGRIVGVLLAAGGAVAVLASAAMLVLLSATVGGAGPARASPVPAAVAGFALVGLVVATGAAEVTRRPLADGPWRLPVVGSVLGAAAATVVLALGAGAGGAGVGADAAADAFVGAVADATSVALVGPIAGLLLLSALALVATASRAAGTAAVSLLDRGRSTALGTAAATLVAIAVALAALAGGVDGSAALTRFGPLVAVPLTAVLAALTAAPALRRGAGRAPLVVLAVAVLLGWLLVDHLLVPGERGPLLDLFGLPDASPWRTAPALGLLVAAIGGAVAGGLAHRPPAAVREDSTERLPAIDVASPK